ncbi:YTH domain-containing family protein 2 [Dichanthelium oligosanthes]|uniref:YTH domain-containing family protein n=1 Tax=Dichanthelium oligosanthes TaxID=888268 RepID=A0A1E5V0W9_9POAL|nr:YTH domain-containing family protein 2 [Dichanthelium oligosanthes]
MDSLKIDASTKASNVNLRAKKDASSSDAVSCISSGDAASTVKESEMNQEASIGDQGMYYYGYYYPGSYGGWDENGYFVGYNGLEMHPAVSISVDGQYVSKEPYYSTAIPMQDPSTPGIFAQPIAYGPELAPAYSWDPSFVLLDGVQGPPVGTHQTNYAARPKYSSNKHGVPSSKAARSAKSAPETIKGSSSALETVPNAANSSSLSKGVNKASGASITKGYVPSSKFVTHNNSQGKSSVYQSKGIDVKESGKSWNNSEKLKTRSKLNGHGDSDISNENNNTDNSKHSLSPQGCVVGLSSAGDANDIIPSPATISKNTYNLPDFVTKYEQALFFVIKSYSEDDIHKSIKYNVWASTPNGNKRLDNAYRLAQERMAEKETKCPVFLFFSVNASGQFCGVAEMVGPVDFNRNMNFWQQDKWNGFFSVKWHIIKDVPNPQFRHIILENNENKPVTNSRDTQEVKFPQGTEMLNIFKNFLCKTSILDDFDFYENRQKVMQDRRGKPLTTSFDHPLPKAEKPAEIKKQTQLVSDTELDRTKSNGGQGIIVGMVLDMTKKNEEQSNNVAEVLDVAQSNKEEPSKVATEG